jgi:hypothetical protein
MLARGDFGMFDSKLTQVQVQGLKDDLCKGALNMKLGDFDFDYY